MLVITDTMFTAEGVAQPGAIVRVSFDTKPLFINFGTRFVLTSPAQYEVTTDVSGNFTLSLPRGSEVDPPTAKVILEFADGSTLTGIVPEAATLASPATLHDLQQNRFVPGSAA